MIRLARGSVLLLLMSAAGAAQTATPIENARPERIQPTSSAATVSSDLPDAPSAGSRSSEGEGESGGTRFAPPALTVGKDTEARFRTVDRRFILLHALSTLALVADVETTVRDLQGQKANEVNPLFGAHPTRARLYGVGVPLNVFSFYLSYHYKKADPSRSLWKIGPGLSIAVHTAAAINNLIVARQ
jgi:hypothetical protein